MNAQNAGAEAVIVYDNVYEALIIMAKPIGNLDPDIPSVFVSQKAGIVMRKMIATGETYAEILPVINPHPCTLLPFPFPECCCLTASSPKVPIRQS